MREHTDALSALGVRVQSVRTPAELEGVEALVLPGGESTTLGMLLRSSGLDGPLRERLAGGMPAFGTCAGMILLATTVLDGRADQVPLAAIDIVVRRNAFGRQLESFESDLSITGLDSPMHAVFIRAPIVERYGEGVRVLAAVEYREELRPVVCQEGRVLIASFHPELTSDRRLHELFLTHIGI